MGQALIEPATALFQPPCIIEIWCLSSALVLCGLLCFSSFLPPPPFFFILFCLLAQKLHNSTLCNLHSNVQPKAVVKYHSTATDRCSRQRNSSVTGAAASTN